MDEKKEDRFRYRALEHRGGYLGYLGGVRRAVEFSLQRYPLTHQLRPAKSTQTLGPLVVGDVLSKINETDVRSYDAIQRVLKDIKPGKEVQLAVTRMVEGQPQQLTFKATLSQTAARCLENP